MTHSLRARTERIQRAAIKNCAVLWYAGSSFNFCVNLANGNRVRVGEVMESAYNHLHLNWSVLLVALGDTGSERYQKAVQVRTPEQMLMSQLQPYLEPIHRDLIDTMPRHHMHNIGWIARTDGKEWNEEDAFDIFERMGAYNNKVEYEECISQNT